MANVVNRSPSLCQSNTCECDCLDIKMVEAVNRLTFCSPFSIIPLEMSELLLLKTVVRLFVLLGKTTEAEQVVFTTLASVSRDWWQTITGWPESNTRHWFRRQARRRLKHPKLLGAMVDGPEICGVTQLDDELYLLRYKATEQVEVYDTICFRLHRCLSIPDLCMAWSFPMDLASCKRNRCLYVSDANVKCVHRLDLEGNAIRWSVDGTLYGLSVTVSFSLLVTCIDVRSIIEFSTRGDLIRQIRLQSNMVVHPWHTVQLDNGQFVVCHNSWPDPISPACLVDWDGRTVRTYGRQSESAAERLSEPVYLAVDGDQFVFVADRSRRRILMLTCDLKYVREVASRYNGLQRLPRRLLVDPTRRRLYVAENDFKNGKLAGRLVIIALC